VSTSVRPPSGEAFAGEPSGSSDEASSPFEPLAVERLYPRPRARVDPDTDKGWFRRMLPLVTAHKALLTGSAVAALVAMLAQVAVPAVVRAAIDRALVDETEALAPFVVALLLLAVTRGTLAFAYRYGLFRMAYEIEYDLRGLIFEHLAGLSFSFYDRVQSGQIISRANSDIRSVQMVLAFAPLMGMSMLSFVIAVAYMASIDVPLTIVAVAALPAVYVVGKRLRDLIFPLSWIVQSRLAVIATIVDENVNGVRVVKSFAAEQRQLTELARSAQGLRWAAVSQNDARARYGPIIENVPRLGLAAVLVYGGWLAIDGTVTIGTVVAFTAYVVLLQTPFRLLGFFLMLAQRAAASAGRIYEILDEDPAVVDRPDAEELATADGRIDLEGVRFGYGDGAPILDGIDLHVPAGETVALVGRTGSGKSTIARLIPRFYDVDEGAIRLDGHDIRDLTLVSLRHHVGVIGEDPFLFSTSLRDNIAFARPDASDEEVEAAARAAEAHDFIAALPDGYDSVVGERGYTLSGGQRQRIAIARALLAAPEVLVLDDATSAIDVHVEAAIHRGLRSLLAERTTLIVAHRLSSVRLAERVVVLEGGRIVADGTHERLLDSEPRYVEIVSHLDDHDHEATTDRGADG
jgi:ATP-binding cassette subfamily B protein